MVVGVLGVGVGADPSDRVAQEWVGSVAPVAGVARRPGARVPEGLAGRRLGAAPYHVVAGREPRPGTVLREVERNRKDDSRRLEEAVEVEAPRQREPIHAVPGAAV